VQHQQTSSDGISNIASNTISKQAFLVHLMKDVYLWHHPVRSAGGFQILTDSGTN